MAWSGESGGGLGRVRFCATTPTPLPGSDDCLTGSHSSAATFRGHTRPVRVSRLVKLGQVYDTVEL